MEVSNAAPTDSSQYLCLRCRGTGHVFNDCPNDWFAEYFPLSEQRRLFDFGSFEQLQHQPLCARCEDLDLLDFLETELPWDTLLNLQDSTVRESGALRSLGDVGTILFTQTCSLCRCLFAMTPDPPSGDCEIVLLPSWTMCRLEGGISIDTPEKQRFCRCLLVTLDPYPSPLRLADSVQRIDALCVVEEDRVDPETTLGGRVIDPQTTSLEIVEGWMASCSELHPITCKPNWAEELRAIHLIDVVARKLVPHPHEQCDYIALSYVWGGVRQGSYKLGDVLQNIPQTIEDAITFTVKLGRRYLWVDSVCIDQSNEVEKYHQIRIMRSIYEGATATIIAMSGASADAGLPRLRPNSSITMFSQMKGCIRGRRLVGLMPTLSQLIWVSTWGNRAWTLQEALLSRRCIYMSDQQLYFECNAMQCSESLAESRSWVHQTRRDAAFLRDGHSEPAIGAGVLRSPFVGATSVNDRLVQYTVLANLYSLRDMTFDEDAINGFSGIIQYLTRLEYKQGFFWGLPVEDLNWALGWGVRYGSATRRAAFPTWSWAGWKAALAELTPFDAKTPHFHRVPLKIWRLDCGVLVPLLELPKTHGDGLEVLPLAHPLQALIAAAPEDPAFDVAAVADTDTSALLFVEGLVLTLRPDFSRPRSPNREPSPYDYFDEQVGDVPVLLIVNGADAMVVEGVGELSCLLLARDGAERGDFLHLLVLGREYEADGEEWEKGKGEGKGEVGVYCRKGVLTLQMDKGSDGIWRHLEARKRRIMLR